MRTICKVIGWTLVFAIVALSVGPSNFRPTTVAASDLEHFAIYLATGVVFAIGYSDRLPIVTLALLLFSGSIEIVQLWVPTRHARLSDFLVSLVAVCMAVGAAILAKSRLRP